jgi:acyl-CoA dehydrogenase
VNFDFSDDEKMVRDQISRFLMDNCGTAAYRQALEGEITHAEAVWQGLAEMGVTASAIPEAFGGVDAGYLSLCLTAEQIGAHLAPVPFSSSIYLAAEALLLFGSDSQKETWLPKLSAGKVIGTLAVSEGTHEPTEDNIETSVSAGKINGKKLIVPHGAIADVSVVLARGENGISMYLVELGDAVHREAIETVDPTMASASIRFDGAGAKLLGIDGAGMDQLARVYDRAAVLYAFEQIGGAERALNMAVEYAKERFAFGRPIGSFQALKHMMADMYVALKLAESNCYYAAWALSNDSGDLPLAAATARVSATQAFQLCARDNIQVHGGMGFTWEYDCHLYYRRSNYLTLVLGGLSTWEDKLVNALPKGEAA